MNRSPLRGLVVNPKRSPSFVALSIALSLCFAIISSGAMKAEAQEQANGREILLRSIRTYNSLKSYQCKSNTDVLMVDEAGKTLQDIGQACELSFRRPNRLRLDISTPWSGRVIWSNSSDFGVYDGLDGIARVVKTRPTMETLLPLLYKQAGTAAYFDALYGICRADLPVNLTDFRLKQSTVYNGHPVFVVAAVLKTGNPSTWTWWIDRNTWFLYKIEQTTKSIRRGYEASPDGSKMITPRNVQIIIRSIISESRPNAAISEDKFLFKPPTDTVSASESSKRDGAK